MALSKVLGILVIPAFVMSCAPQTPPPVIQGQPIYDKFGGQIGCESGAYIPGAQMQDQCLPLEECDPQRPSTSQRPCLPPPGRCNPQLAALDPNCPPIGEREEQPTAPGRNPIGQGG